MERAPAWHTSGRQGPRAVNADAVARSGGVVALADGIGDTLEASTAALTAATAAVRVPSAAGPAAALVAAHDALSAGDCVLVVAQRFGATFRIGWVGDVRAWAWDGSTLTQLTVDHTLAQYFRDHGEPVAPRMEHLVTTTVRTARPSQYGVTETSAASLLLTTDGVHKVLSARAMANILRHSPEPAASLVAAAATTDNATALFLPLAAVNSQPTRPIAAAA